MNQKGKDFIKSVNERIEKYKSSVFKFQYPSEKQIIERVMRLGEETRVFDLKTPGLGSFEITDDLREIAVATIKEDFLKNFS